MLYQDKVLYHGTSMAVMNKIMDLGLLSRELLTEFGDKVVHPAFTKEGSVYFTESLDCACSWGSYHQFGEAYPARDSVVVLAIKVEESDLESIIDDRNFWSGSGNFEYRADHIPPHRLFRVDGNRLVPLKAA